MISTLNASNSGDKNHIILVSALVVLATLATVWSLQTLQVHASEVKSTNSKINWYDKAVAVN